MCFEGSNGSFWFPDSIFPRSDAADELVLAPQDTAERMRSVATAGRKLGWARDVLQFQGRYGMLERPLVSEAYRIIEDASQNSGEDGATATYLLAILQLDPDKKRQYFQEAIKKGSARAWYRVGTSSEMRGDYERGKKRYVRGVRKEDIASLYRLALASRPVDVESLSRAALGADTDFPLPAYVYGLLLLGEVEITGIDRPQRNPEVAFQFIQRAAALGHAPAQMRMCAAYQGGYRGFDCVIALRYLHLAARQEAWLSYQKFPTTLGGEPASQLVKWLLCGYPGVLAPNELMAFRFAEWGAAQDEPTALFAMGYFYEVGIGCTQNIPLSLEYYRKSASKDCDAAKARLGQISSPLRRTLTRKDHNETLRSHRSQNFDEKKDPRMMAIKPGSLPYADDAETPLNEQKQHPRNVSTPYPVSPEQPVRREPLPYPTSPLGAAQQPVHPSEQPQGKSAQRTETRPFSMPPTVNAPKPVAETPQNTLSDRRPLSTVPSLPSDLSSHSETSSVPRVKPAFQHSAHLASAPSRSSSGVLTREKPSLESDQTSGNTTRRYFSSSETAIPRGQPGKYTGHNSYSSGNPPVGPDANTARLRQRAITQPEFQGNSFMSPDKNRSEPHLPKNPATNNPFASNPAIQVNGPNIVRGKHSRAPSNYRELSSSRAAESIRPQTPAASQPFIQGSGPNIVRGKPVVPSQTTSNYPETPPGKTPVSTKPQNPAASPNVQGNGPNIVSGKPALPPQTFSNHSEAPSGKISESARPQNAAASHPSMQGTSINNVRGRPAVPSQKLSNYPEVPSGTNPESTKPLGQLNLDSPKEPAKSATPPSRSRNVSPSKMAGRLKRFVSGGYNTGSDDLRPPSTIKNNLMASDSPVLSTPEYTESSSPESSPNSSPRMPQPNSASPSLRSLGARTDSLTSEATSQSSLKKPGVAYTFDDMGIKTVTKDKKDTCVIF